MNRDLVLRRERPGDLETTRALHDVAFGVPAGSEHSVETRSWTGCGPMATSSTP